MNLELGLLGHPVSHSLSPPMHEAALAYFRLQGRYRLFDVAPADLDARLKELFAEGLTGFNVTIPHKDAMFARAAQHTEQAKRARAVNCVVVQPDGSLRGHNTDIEGFAHALNDCFLEKQHDDFVASHPACILGAGGASKAALLALEDLGLHRQIFVIARDLDKAQSVVSEVFAAGSPEIDLHCLRCDALPDHFSPSLIINSTPIGQYSMEIPTWLKSLLKRDSRAFFYDMVYAKGSGQTPLVALAQEYGLSATDGTDMLLHQAILSFEFWTGKRPPNSVMKDALLQARL